VMMVLPEVGGILDCRGVKVVIPPGAVFSPQELQLTVYEDSCLGDGDGGEG